jgi:small GTP-binding protein
MLKRILTPKQEEILKAERVWLADLQVILAKLGALEEDLATLKNSSQQLDELFLLVVVGEFNAGKSAFINALLGQSILPEGVTPTTAQVNILRFGQASERQVLESHLHALAEPIDILRQINIVDTPGTNAVIRKHQTITEDFVPRSDLVLFITSADRPFTESERQFLSQIKDWGKKVVIAINKIDLFETPEELEQVVAFVRENAQALLGVTPDIFPISARRAKKAKQGQAAHWSESGFETLETYVHNTLDETKRIQLKFLNPLGVGERLLNKYLEITNNRLSLLAEDFKMLDNLQNQLDFYRQDMERDFKLRLSDIENVLYEMEKRGNAFFDETMRLARVIDLMNKNRIQGEFERNVVADTPQMVERKVNELIDWFVSADLNQWQAVMKHLNQRKEAHNKDNIIGEVGASFRYDREHLIDSVGRAAQRAVDTYDKTIEAQQIAEGAQRAVAASAMTEVGAIGLGALLTALVHTVAADVTGIVAASLVAALGLFVIPAKRRRAKKEMTEKIATLRRHLIDAMSGQFDKELSRSIQRINEAVSPYTRFVRAERKKLEGTKTDLLDAQQTQGRLRAEIEAL